MGEMGYRRVDVLPDREGVLSDIPRAVGFLLTRLFSHERALLHAERLGAESERDVTWYVRPRGPSGEGQDVPAAALPAGTSAPSCPAWRWRSTSTTPPAAAGGAT